MRRGKAQCFLDKDRQKMLAVIEASFGTFTPFNKAIHQIFAVQLLKERTESLRLENAA